MIRFFSADYKINQSMHIVFDAEGMEKMVLVLNRALNTYHDKELTELLDQIKSYQEKS